MCYLCNIELTQKFPIRFPVYVFSFPMVGNTNIERMESFSRVHNVYHEIVDLLRLHHHLFGNAIQMLLWKMKERRESAVASKIHVSLCVDVIRFRTWFHRIQVSWLREQIPLPHFLNETSVPCFFRLYDIVSRLKKYGYLFNFKNLKKKEERL